MRLERGNKHHGISLSTLGEVDDQSLFYLGMIRQQLPTGLSKIAALGTDARHSSGWATSVQAC